jgi:ATP-dependent Lon protease
VANPLVIVDEVEKAGEVHSDRCHAHGLTNALLPLLERSTAASWPCPYYQIAFDMSWMSWVMTANTTWGLSGPLLSRCPPLRLPALTRDQLMTFAAREVRRRDLPDDVRDAVLQILSEESGSWQPSLRTALRMIERAEGVADRPVLH